MPEGILFAAQDTRSFDRPIARVEVNTGQVIASRRSLDPTPPTPVVIDAGDYEDLDGVGAYDLYSFGGASVTVTYAGDLVEEPTIRGDSDEDGKQTGSFESRTVEELKTLARERGIDNVSDLKKKEVIAELRRLS